MYEEEAPQVSIPKVGSLIEGQCEHNCGKSYPFVVWYHSTRWLRLSYCFQLDHDLVPPSNREQVIFLGKGGHQLSTMITFKQRRCNYSQGGNDGNDGQNTDGEEYFINGRGGGILQDFQ